MHGPKELWLALDGATDRAAKLSVIRHYYLVDNEFVQARVRPVLQDFVLWE